MTRIAIPTKSPIVCKARGPFVWAFRTHNTEGARVPRFLADAEGVDPVLVPSRRNRAVIFDSDLFHRTADLDFRQGDENRRINVTMLFGCHRAQIPA